MPVHILQNHFENRPYKSRYHNAELGAQKFLHCSPHHDGWSPHFCCYKPLGGPFEHLSPHVLFVPMQRQPVMATQEIPSLARWESNGRSISFKNYARPTSTYLPGPSIWKTWAARTDHTHFRGLWPPLDSEPNAIKGTTVPKKHQKVSVLRFLLEAWKVVRFSNITDLCHKKLKYLNLRYIWSSWVFWDLYMKLAVAKGT